MNPQQQSDVEQWLTDTGLGDTWHQPAPSAAEFLAAHPDPSGWSSTDVDVIEHLTR
ncbi:hypothetical protein [Streptomyces sp. NPDC051173]|uniref:hypothetical protein n=1 Tax=Streptomyces sp. NPDC051173 TaxID=3155164 RepID=UPI003450F78A